MRFARQWPRASCRYSGSQRPLRARALASRRHSIGTSLAGAPLLVPGAAASMRGALLRWCGERRIDPHIVGEFDDSALMKAFGAAGAGLFPVPAAVAGEVRRQFGVEPVGRLEGVEVRYYAVSVERRLTHPAVLAVTREARRALFAGGADHRDRARRQQELEIADAHEDLARWGGRRDACPRRVIARAAAGG
jgi:DNA-binding transcriptional LysR family regulator